MADQVVPEISGVEIVEDSLLKLHPSVLRILLQDKTTKRNIIWATKDYVSQGEAYMEWCEILPELVTGDHAFLIQPRSAKAKGDQTARTRDKAEVFTPSWVCNKQNNLVDEQWFGKAEVFNTETDQGWITNSQKIVFPNTGSKTWKKYVDTKRMEITCGEAPYLVSRYDTVTGNLIPVQERIGLLDRKLRVVSENTQDEEEWFNWVLRAYQSVYGYEFQGDNLLLARENLFVSFIEYYRVQFCKSPTLKQQLRIANVISWNIWQMDGMKYVVPNSCTTEKIEEFTLFGSVFREIQCSGCEKGLIHKHNGIYCKVFDWRRERSLLFVSMMKGVQS